MNKKVSNKIHLITYPDSLGGDLRALDFVLNKYFSKEIKGVHILPFYPSTADRGFTPKTHEIVDPAFGSWEDVKKISKNHELTCDLMINHISSQSKQFQDYLKNGENSQYADWFVTGEKFSRRFCEKTRQKIQGKLLSLLEKTMNKFRRLDIFFHKHGVNKFVLKRIYRPRTGSPFVKFKLGDGTSQAIWCTFSPDQIDLDVANSGVKKMFEDAISRFNKNGISLVRLDAVGYIGKKRGTSNFLIPEAYTFMEQLAEKSHSIGLKILPEIRYHYKAQLDLAKKNWVDYVYDFGTPAIALHSFYSGNASKLKHWIQIRPQNNITVLDTHDGIGIVDVKGFLTEKQIDNLTLRLYENGGNPLKRSLGQKANKNEVYQMNLTFYEALNKNDDAYISARVLQFFLPGIPQVYYVGLLAGLNDYAQYQKTNHGRDVNRHNYTLEEIEKNLNRPVVQRLLKLIRFRNTHPAFQGDFKVLDSKKHKIKLRWEKDDSFCEAIINFHTKKSKIRYSDPKNQEKTTYKP